MTNKEFTNKLILGDNLEKLKEIESESIDLIYADPPFFSNRDYEVIWGDEGEIRSFEDRWAGDIEHYIGWLRERVEEMYRVLKPTGSLFLHCDWHASHYIKVDILDRKDLFGRNNFINEIIWKRTRNPKGSQFEKRSFGLATDSIFWYAKSNKYYFDEVAARNQLFSEELDKKYNLSDEIGAYYSGPIIRSASMGERPNLVYEYKGFTPEKYGWRMTKEKLIELDEKGDLGWSSTGTPFKKLRPENDKGDPVYNLWDDINRLYSKSPETIGYPTQKPEALLERIILCASKEGDLVLDPFVGGGTTVAVADKLNRRWIGIDHSVMAVKVTDYRLKKQKDAFSQEYELVLRNYNYDELKNPKLAFKFEKFIVEKFGGIPNKVQRGDLGLDGKMPNKIPIQVKQQDNVGRNVVDNFIASIQRYDKKLFDKNVKERTTAGYIIGFSFGKGAIEEVARLANKENIIIELKKVSEIIDYSKPPKVSLTADELEHNEYQFIAQAESEAGIEFYSWDFNHNETEGFKPDILLDKEGKQKRKFQSGEHQIAVEAVDKSGLDGTDKVKIKVKK